MIRPKARRTHTLPPTTPLSQQVGGHAGVQVTEDESLLLKPAQSNEVRFYQFVRDVDESASGVHVLRSWIPKFFGLLSLEGKLASPAADVESGSVPVIVPVPDTEGAPPPGALDNANGTASADVPAQTLVLENLLYGYHKPCVLDVKLGTKLYDECASEEKKARMIKKAAESTSLQTGIRLTGFQIYSNNSPEPIVYGKQYGYSLKPEQLQEGIGNFFPCSTSTSDIGLPPETLFSLLTSIHASLSDLRTSLSTAHVRIVGGSVLIIYEGDSERAAAASGRGGGPGCFDETEVDEDEDEQIEVEIDEKGEIVMEQPLNDTSETMSSVSSSELLPRSYTVSLIDFAHTRVVPGEGPDQGVLVGMDTLIRLVAQRKEEVMACSKAEGHSDR